MNQAKRVDTNFLPLSWSISKGRDTLGYNICRLDDNATDKRYRCSGGGYDMIGTVVADWLKDVYQYRLTGLIEQQQGQWEPMNYSQSDWYGLKGIYGITFRVDTVTKAIIKISVDGACGLSSIKSLAEAIGISVSSVCNRKGHTTGFMVTIYESSDHMKEM